MVENTGVGGRVAPRRAPDRRLVDVDHLVEGVHALDPAVAARDLLGLVDALHQGPQQDVVHQGGLARPRYARHHHEAPGWELDVDVPQVVLPGPFHHQPALRLPAQSGQGHEPLARQVLAGQGGLGPQQFLDGPRHHDLAAVLPRSWPDVDDVVGGADGLLVVFHDDDRVADVPQPDQGVDQLAVVALVEPDGRLVQDVQDPDQPAAYLGGQPDALRFPTGQGAGVAVEGKVVEAHVHQELQPRLHFFEHPVGDQMVPLGKREALRPFRRVADRQVAQLEYAPPSDRDGQALGLQPGAAALAAGHFPHIALDLLPHVVRLGFGMAALQVAHHALISRVVGTGAAVTVFVVQVDLGRARPIQDDLLVLLFELAPRDRRRDAEGLGHPLEQPPEILVARPRPTGPRHRRRSKGRGRGPPARGRPRNGSQAVTTRARPIWRIEREIAWRQLVVRGAAHRAGQVLRER